MEAKQEGGYVIKTERKKDSGNAEGPIIVTKTEPKQEIGCAGVPPVVPKIIIKPIKRGLVKQVKQPILIAPIAGCTTCTSDEFSSDYYDE